MSEIRIVRTSLQNKIYLFTFFDLVDLLVVKFKFMTFKM